MKLLTCKLCDRQFDRSNNFKRHINRKYSCKPEYYPDQKMTEIKTESDNFNLQLNQSESQNEKYKCCYCKRKFTTSSNMTRHINKYCKTQKKQESEKEELYQTLLKQIKEKDEKLQEKDLIIQEKDNKIQNLTVNNTTNNICNSNNQIINNNITINAFGKEDLSHITYKDYKEIFYSSSKSVPKLISIVHFNRKKPDNANIYISNLKDAYVMVYDGKQWNMLLKDDTIDELFDNKILFLESKYNKLAHKLDTTTKKRFDRFLNNLEHSKIENIVKKEIKLLLYNSRLIPLKNKKQTESIE
jgi:uncharacterized C2H2 Zn-finger protein